jgi:CelD/BcsL family acetyltransferase involved in cellulose biosynthesis
VPDDRWIVTEHVGPKGLAAVADSWRRLYDEMASPMIWHSHEAYTVYLENLCPFPDRFRCLTLSDGERVRAILPIEERFERGFGLPIRVWGMPWRNSWRPTDAIGPEDDARRALLPAVLRYLRKQSGRRAILVVGQTWDRSALWDGLADVPSSQCYTFPDGAEYVVPTDMPLEAFLARLSSKSRGMLRKSARDFEALPGATYVRAATPDELAVEYGHFLDVEASGWKGDAGTAIKLHDELVAFYRGLIERVVEDGHCEIHSLHAEDRCIASEFCVYTRRECAGLKSGYDERYSHLAPGRLAAHKTLEWSCEDDDVDFVSEVSNAPWLRQWRPEEHGLRRAYVSLRPISGWLLLAGLRFRYGPARRIVRSFEAWRRGREQPARKRPARNAG